MPCKHENGIDPCDRNPGGRCRLRMRNSTIAWNKANRERKRAAAKIWWDSNKWSAHKRNCQRNGRNNELNETQFYHLCKQPCVYCNKAAQPFLNGVDRVENEYGYTLRNSIPCCAPCNFMKGKMSAKDFITRVNATAAYTQTYEKDLKPRRLKIQEELAKLCP